jgi:hypothetical protein
MPTWREMFDPLTTAAECHEAIDACLAQAVSPRNFGTPATLTWLDRSKRLVEHGRARWPEDFPTPVDCEPCEGNGCEACNDMGFIVPAKQAPASKGQPS